MGDGPTTSISEHCATLTDPRVERSTERLPIDVVTIAVCGGICGADDGVAIETFGREEADWLRAFLPLRGGIPSHDPFGRVFARLAPDELRRGSLAWVQALAGAVVEHDDRVIAVEGKTPRRSHDRAKGTGAPHPVSAWASAGGPVRGQQAVDRESHEITAIPHLSRLLALAGAAVTIDAMGRQAAIAEQIVQAEADSVLALEGNQSSVHDRARRAFADARRAAGTPPAPTGLDVATAVNTEGARAARTAPLLGARRPGLPRLRRSRPRLAPAPLRRPGRGRTADRRHGDRRHPLLPRQSPAGRDGAQSGDPRPVGHRERLHRVLDVVSHEDGSRVRTDHAPQNFAVLRRFALNLLRQETATTASLAKKRFRAALNDASRCTVLSGLGSLT